MLLQSLSLYELCLADLKGLILLVSIIPSGSHTLSIFFSVGFLDSEGKDLIERSHLELCGPVCNVWLWFSIWGNLVLVLTNFHEYRTVRFPLDISLILDII